MTVYELLDIAAKHMNKSPLRVYLTRKGGMEVGADLFCRTVGSLSFQDNEEIELKSIFAAHVK
jgi:hypothetical protein